MDRIIRIVIFYLLLFGTVHAYADMSFLVSPSVGVSSINNLSGYKNAPFSRVDGAFFPVSGLGVGVFAISYGDFKSSSDNQPVAIKLSAAGVGVTGRWPVHPHVQPYVRIEYMRWDAEATGLGLTLARDRGGSPGLALGVQFPIWRFLGAKAEVSGYNNVSGANLRQFSAGLVFEF